MAYLKNIELIRQGPDKQIRLIWDNDRTQSLHFPPLVSTDSLISQFWGFLRLLEREREEKKI